MNTPTKNSLIICALLLVTTSALLFLSSTIESPTHHPAPALAVDATEIAPDEILGMEKIVVSCGTDALQLVKQSHSGSIDNVLDVAIVHYMKEDRLLSLWTTLYPNETIASTENEKMAVAMQKWGGSWASNLRAVTIAGKPVYETSSGEVTHYFWAENEWVFYIIPHNFTQDEIAMIIGAIP